MLLYKNNEIREKNLQQIKELIVKLNDIPDDIMSYIDVNHIQNYLTAYMRIIKKEMEDK